MNQPEPDPGNPRKVTTMIFTDAELSILNVAVKLFKSEDCYLDETERLATDVLITRIEAVR